MANFGKRSTAEQVSEGCDLGGQTILITGANTGIGKETARVLALRGAHVVMACRNPSKAMAAKEDILNDSGGQVSADQLELRELDLNSLDGVRKFGEAFAAEKRSVHQLINNAGVMLPARKRTDDDFEAHLGINHLGHFLLTHHLLDSLKRAEGARVICVSSMAASFARLDDKFNDLNWKERKHKGMQSYGDSKLMNLMFAKELTRRYGKDGICANALHPGVINTELGRDQGLPFKLVGLVVGPWMKTIPQGAATTVRLATGPEYATRGGLYLSDCQEAPAPHKLARNDAACDKLWQISEQLTGLA
jgi:NAD(P)-dependent dehydrogenase (short-subunit alcohol dehydrogenase family)